MRQYRAVLLTVLRNIQLRRRLVQLRLGNVLRRGLCRLAQNRNRRLINVLLFLGLGAAGALLGVSVASTFWFTWSAGSGIVFVSVTLHRSARAWSAPEVVMKQPHCPAVTNQHSKDREMQPH